MGVDCTGEADCDQCDIKRALKSSRLRIPFTRVNTVIMEARKEEYSEGRPYGISEKACSNVNPVKVITCRNVGQKYESEHYTIKIRMRKPIKSNNKEAAEIDQHEAASNWPDM